MPCMYNGQPVKGSKGACPTGSTWSDTQPSFLGEDQRLGVDDIGRYLKDRYTTDSGNLDWTKAGLEGIMAVYGGGLARAGLTKGLPSLFKQFQKLYTKPKMKPEIIKKKVLDDLRTSPFTKPIPSSAYKTTTTKTGNKIPVTRINKKGVEVPVRQVAPLRAAGATALGAGGVDFFAPFTEAGLERKQVRDERSAALAAKTKEDEAVKTDAAAVEAAAVQAEKDRVAGLSFTEKMKEPGYWDEKDGTGLTRIEKLGQLMTYYGQTPKQRAATTSPADRWAEMTTANAATAASIQKSMLADTPFSNIGMKGGMDIIKNLIQEEYGDKWYTWGAEKEEVEQITALIYAEMVNLAKLYPGKSVMEYYNQAKKMYDESQEVA